MGEEYVPSRAVQDRLRRRIEALMAVDEDARYLLADIEEPSPATFDKHGVPESFPPNARFFDFSDKFVKGKTIRIQIK
jgi:hypothetical protein